LKVAHLCLSCFYNDGRSYQENELVRQNVVEGHDVLLIASTESITPEGELRYLDPSDYPGSDGARVVRVPYRLWPAKLARKLRVHPAVYARLDAFGPDVVLFHGCCGWEVATAARYALNHPNVLFYIDSHEDWHNSARTWLSRAFLHKLYYRYCLARAWPHARKILCVSTETMDFVAETYGVPRDKLEFYPLGGRIVSDDEYAARRSGARARLHLAEGEILLVQSGKQTRRKKLVEALRAFRATAPTNARLKIAGTLGPDIRDEASRMIEEDPRVEFLGWKNATELIDLLCAADVYLQPGTQSVTMQQSLCCRCAVIIDDVPSHTVYVDGTGWLISDRAPLEAVFAGIAKADLARMQERSFAIASRMLDYAKLANRVLSPNP
jgi:hypothetical protein